MSRKDRFNVTLYTNPSGAQVYRVQGRMPDGRQVRRNFRTKEEAVGYKGQLEVEALNETVRVPLKHTRLTDEQLADAEVAVHRLEGTGKGRFVIASSPWNGVGFGNGVFLMVGPGGAIQSCLDGASWNARGGV